MYRQSEKKLLPPPHVLIIWWNGLLTAEICWRVWGTPANFNGFRVLAALLHGIPVLGVSQSLRWWTEGATHILQGGHHVGHWPTFLVFDYVQQTNLANCQFLSTCWIFSRDIIWYNCHCRELRFHYLIRGNRALNWVWQVHPVQLSSIS